MRDQLLKNWIAAQRKFEKARTVMQQTRHALHYHDVLNTGYHNKIVKNSVYPNGIIVTDNMRFDEVGKLMRISGAVLRKDGTPTVRIGSIWFPHSGPIETDDIPVMARMFYNGEPVFNFAFTQAENAGAFTFITTTARTGSYIDGKVSFNDGTIINQVATWEFVNR